MLDLLKKGSTLYLYLHDIFDLKASKIPSLSGDAQNPLDNNPLGSKITPSFLQRGL